MAKESKTTQVKYFASATAKCLNCGSVYTLGMTTETLSLEVCANCHPFYTGQETLLDSAGRIEKFQKKLDQAATGPKSSKVKTRKIKIGADIMADSEPA